MKIFLNCLAILAVANLAYSQTFQTSSEELIENVRIKMVKNYLKERQALLTLKERTEKVCPGYGARIELALQKTQRCTDDIDEDNETMCSAVENHFEKCMNPIVSLFEECLPERSKDIPSFVTKAMVAMSKKLCRTDGEHIFELSNQCVMSNNYRTQRCVRRLQTKAQQYDTKVPTKEDLCQFLSSFRGCLQSHLTASCGHVKTREAFLDLYDAALTSCEDTTLNEIEVLETNPKLV